MTPRALSLVQRAFAIKQGWLNEFTEDGPSDYGVHHGIVALGWLVRPFRPKNKWRRFNHLTKEIFFRHDCDHWLGEWSGLTREQSNELMGRRLNIHFPEFSSFYEGGTNSFSWLPHPKWGWRYGWTKKLHDYVKEHGELPTIE
jgi:hypothetical protein